MEVIINHVEAGAGADLSVITDKHHRITINIEDTWSGTGPIIRLKVDGEIWLDDATKKP